MPDTAAHATLAGRRPPSLPRARPQASTQQGPLPHANPQVRVWLRSAAAPQLAWISLVRQAGRGPGQDEPGQHIGLERRQLIRPRRGARLTQFSYDGQAEARASLAFTDPGRPATDAIDLQQTRETVTRQDRDDSGKEAQVQGLQRSLSPQGTLGLFIRKRACTTGTSPAAYRCFFVLEACGLAVQLVHAAQAKNLPGRPKTDLSRSSVSSGRRMTRAAHSQRPITKALEAADLASTAWNMAYRCRPGVAAGCHRGWLLRNVWRWPARASESAPAPWM